MLKKCWLSKNNLLVNIHKYTYFLYIKIKALVIQILEDNNQIEI